MTEVTRAWLILFAAGIFEVMWAIGLKYSEGFTKLWPSVFTVLTLIVSMGLLAYSVRILPIGTAYAVWTGIGAVGTVIMGIMVFNEPRDIIRISFIFLIITGIAGLKFYAR